MEIPQHFFLWAKTNKGESSIIHPLIYHMVDVGECILALWNNALSQQTRSLFSNILKLNQTQAGQLLAFWGSLHDLGKAAPGFQRKYSTVIPLLKQAGLIFPPPIPNQASHGEVTAWALSGLLAKHLGYDPFVARKIARSVGGHHGTWPSIRALQALERQPADTGDDTWEKARESILNELNNVFQPPVFFNFPEDQKEENAFLTLLSGFVSLSDWIGSIFTYFLYEPEYLHLITYAARSQQIATLAIFQLGWTGWRSDGKSKPFTEMFPGYLPRDTQQAVFDVVKNLHQPALLILEAPTGSGKTETALYLAETWLQNNLGQGIYIAMPTQATSNQMFDRVHSFLTNCYPDAIINYHLVHGSALISEKDKLFTPIDINDEGSQPQEGGVRAQGWFLPRKRTLLAPFGVGTVDQTLMSVLQGRHFFVRLFGLGQKIVVFDEVHAYDTYMSRLFEHLLAWLRSIGTSVILLTATLPEKTRSRLAAAWLGKKDINLPQRDYPRLTIASDGMIDTVALPPANLVVIKLDWIESDPIRIAEHVAKKLEDGGCAAIICNRVIRAQDIYKAIKTHQIVEDEYLFLFHARYPFAWRNEIEKKVLGQFSKNGLRPQKAIVVATQVIEQSLDLDFDYMLTDLAPVDLLIQRAGRLHRHTVNAKKRPAKLANPEITISMPKIIERIPDFGADEFVYDRAVLLSTWMALQGKTHLRFPEEISSLIETVYSETIPPSDPDYEKALHVAMEKAKKEHSREVSEALRRIIPSVDDEELLTTPLLGLEEDDPGIHATFRALTRLSDPSVSLVCLHQFEGKTYLEPHGRGDMVDLEIDPDRNLTRRLLEHTVTIQHWEVLKYFTNRAYPITWKNNGSLRFHRPVVFDETGVYRLEGTSYFLYLSKETGLEIRKETA